MQTKTFNVLLIWETNLPPERTTRLKRFRRKREKGRDVRIRKLRLQSHHVSGADLQRRPSKRRKLKRKVTVIRNHRSNDRNQNQTQRVEMIV